MKLRRLHRRADLARRSWTDRERHIVWRGLTGRMAIAVEPLLGMVCFAGLTYGVIWRARTAGPPDLWILSPIFALMSFGFAAYFLCVLFAPLIAYLQTFKPIYVIDGYVRYRPPDVESEYDGTGYVAVLFADKDLCCEWESFGKKKLPELILAAHAEFSEFGGIHKIDGKSTGVIPDGELPLLAIGIAPRR